MSPVHNFTESLFNTTNSDDDIVIDQQSDSCESILQEEEDFVSINHLCNVRTSHIRNFMAAYLNINSLRNKFYSVNDLIQRNSLDFMSIAETKLDKSYKDGCFAIDNYRSFRKDNTVMSGGLFVFVRSDILGQRRPALECKYMEYICIKVTLGMIKWLIAFVYKIQHIKDPQYEELMSQLIDDIIMNYYKYVIMGDVNFDMLSSNSDENSVSNISNLFDLKHVITLPTFFKTPRGTLLNVILTPNIKCLPTHGVIDTGLSNSSTCHNKSHSLNN